VLSPFGGTPRGSPPLEASEPHPRLFFFIPLLKTKKAVISTITAFFLGFLKILFNPEADDFQVFVGLAQAVGKNLDDNIH